MCVLEIPSAFVAEAGRVQIFNGRRRSSDWTVLSRRVQRLQWTKEQAQPSVKCKRVHYFTGRVRWFGKQEVLQPVCRKTCQAH